MAEREAQLQALLHRDVVFDCIDDVGNDLLTRENESLRARIVQSESSLSTLDVETGSRLRQIRQADEQATAAKVASRASVEKARLLEGELEEAHASLRHKMVVERSFCLTSAAPA
jgi:hypothetical protein